MIELTSLDAIMSNPELITPSVRTMETVIPF